MLNGLRAFSKPGTWLKGNLHTHTTLSDGPLSPDATIERYRSLGYDFLSITDHRRNGADFNRDDGDFVVLGGVELHPLVPWSARTIISSSRRSRGISRWRGASRA